MRNTLVMLAAGLSLACGHSWAQTVDPAGTVMAAPGGRYVFGQISNGRRDQFMLDTQTGQLWQLVCMHSAQGEPACSRTTLQAVQYQETPDLAPQQTPTPPSAARTPPRK